MKKTGKEGQKRCTDQGILPKPFDVNFIMASTEND